MKRRTIGEEVKELLTDGTNGVVRDDGTSKKKIVANVTVQVPLVEVGIDSEWEKGQREYGSKITEQLKAIVQERVAKEDEAQDKFSPSFNLSLLKRKGMTGFNLLYQLQDMFINEQISKGNTEETIRTYKKHFNYLFEFLTFMLSSVEDYKAILDKSGDSERKYGSLMPIKVLEVDDIEVEYRLYLANVLHLSEQTIISRMRNFRVIAYYAMENGWIEKRNIKIKVVKPPIKDVYTDREIDRLLVKPDIDNFTDYRNWVIINYLLATGNRRSTIIQLKVSDINFDDRTIRVNYQKNRTPSVIGLNDRLAKILREYIDAYRTEEDGSYLDNEYLFCNSYGQQWTVDGISKSMAAYMKKHKVHKTSLHLFRHTFAKDWVMAGKDIGMLQQILGHQSLEMVVRYMNLYGKDTRDAVNKDALIDRFKPSSGRKKIQRRI